MHFVRWIKTNVHIRKRKKFTIYLLLLYCSIQLFMLRGISLRVTMTTENKGKDQKVIIYTIFGDMKTYSNAEQAVIDTSKDTDFKLISDQQTMERLIGLKEIPLTVKSAYLMQNKNLCSSAERLDVVILVYTSINHFQRRHIIRQTWGNLTFAEPLGGIRLVFIVGKPEIEMVQRHLEAEHNEFNDILQGDFKDSYRNITLKGVMGLKWVSENCMNAKFVVKTDDDVVIDTRNLLKVIQNDMAGSRRTIFGELRNGQKVNRLFFASICVESSVLPGRYVYPSFIRGYFVGITTDLVPYLFEAAKSTPFFFLEDIYLYGILASRVPGVVYKNAWPNYVVTTDAVVLNACLRTETCRLLAAAEFKPRVMLQLWTCIELRHLNQSAIQSDQRLQCDRASYRTTPLDMDFALDFLFPPSLQ